MVFSLRVAETGVLRNRRVAEQEAGESLRWNENGRRGEPRRPLVQRLRGARLSRARRASPDHDLLVVAANHRVAGLAVEGLREHGHVRRRADRAEIGRGSCRERGGTSVLIPGGAGSLKKKTTSN